MFESTITRGPVSPPARALDFVERASLRFPAWVWALALSLLAVDALCMGLHFFGTLLREGALGPPRPEALGDWRLDRDGSLPERFEYAKTVLLIGLALVCARLRGVAVFGPVVLTAAVLLLDNSLRLHEQSKAVLMPVLGASKGPAELIYMIAVGAALLAALSFGAMRAAADDRRILALFVAVMVILGGFAGVADLLHTLFGSVSKPVDLILAFVEDGGELVTITLACFLIAATAAGRGASPVVSRRAHERRNTFLGAMGRRQKHGSGQA
jgi:hypothetical protein